jgi:hypothetical protein
MALSSIKLVAMWLVPDKPLYPARGSSVTRSTTKPRSGAPPRPFSAPDGHDERTDDEEEDDVTDRTPTMTRRTLGQGLEVSAIGLGCMSTTGGYSPTAKR